MHARGTTAVAHVLGLLGLDLPPETDESELGRAHEKFLASIGSAWDDTSPILDSALASTRGRRFADRLVKLLEKEYDDSPAFVVADARISRLVPLWTRALRTFGAEPRFAIPVENPLDVAAALEARHGFSEAKSLLLWLRHVLDAERHTRGFPRTFVSYEGLLRDWRGTVGAISADLGISWPRFSHDVQLEIEAFLDAEPREHAFDRSDLEARADVADWVKHVYAAASAAEPADPRSTFDTARADLDRAGLAYGPLVADLGRKLTELDAAKLADQQAREALAATVIRQQNAIDSAEEELAGTRAQVTEKDRELVEVTAKLADCETELARVSEELRARAGTLEERTREFESLTGGLAERDAALAQGRDRIARLECEVAMLAAELAFDRDFYLAAYPDVAARGVDPLLHYLRNGAAEGRDPSPFFSTAQYAEAHPELAERGENALVHAVRTGWRPPAIVEEPADPGAALLERDRLVVEAAFDPDYYLAAYPDVAERGVDPISHYLSSGAAEGRDPGPHFSTTQYLAEHPEVLEQGENPFAHAIRAGWRPPAEPASRAEAGLVAQIREVVASTLPPGAMVAVVSRGDDELVALPGRRGLRLLPSDGPTTVAALAELSARGADFVLVPRTSFGWLERSAELREHLERRYRLVVRQQNVCLLYEAKETA